MRAKIYKGKPYGAELTKKESDAMFTEIRKEMLKAIDNNAEELDAMVLLILHNLFGFGKTRLRRFHEAYRKECEKLKDFYQLKEKDEIWYAIRQLQELGLDYNEISGRCE